jgi:hypothetical protein
MATRRSSRKAQSGGKRKTRKMNKKASQWTAFVKKIYLEMKKKNPSVKLGAAMKEASRRKSEM